MAQYLQTDILLRIWLHSITFTHNYAFAYPKSFVLNLFPLRNITNLLFQKGLQSWKEHIHLIPNSKGINFEFKTFQYILLQNQKIIWGKRIFNEVWSLGIGNHLVVGIYFMTDKQTRETEVLILIFSYFDFVS